MRLLSRGIDEHSMNAFDPSQAFRAAKWIFNPGAKQEA
jgi:hypothetical protein